MFIIWLIQSYGMFKKASISSNFKILTALNVVT